MSYCPVEIENFEKEETESSVHVRIPRKMKFPYGTKEMLEVDKIVRIKSTLEFDCVDVEFPVVDGKQLIITGFFLTLPSGTFSTIKTNKVGFIGENDLTEFIQDG